LKLKLDSFAPFIVNFFVQTEQVGIELYVGFVYSPGVAVDRLRQTISPLQPWMAESRSGDGSLPVSCP